MHYKPRDPLLWKVFKLPKELEMLGCLVIILWSIIVIPFLPFFLVFRRWRKTQFTSMLSNNKRLLSWSNFLTLTQTQKGTVIIEVGNKATTRFWWTTDDLLSLAPIDPPKFEELNIISYSGAEQHPFTHWCYENYTSHQTGKALLAYPVEADFETFPFKEDFEQMLKAQFPDQQVIILTFYDVRYI